MLSVTNFQIIQEKSMWVWVSGEGRGGEERGAWERDKMVKIDESGEGYMGLHCTILSTFLQTWNFLKEKVKSVLSLWWEAFLLTLNTEILDKIDYF